MPQTQAFYADGRPIPDQELGAAVSKGEAHFERGARVEVTDASGRPGTVAAEEVGQLLASGGAIQSPGAIAASEAAQAERAQQIETLTNPIEAWKGVQEAGLRGLTFGLSDPALAATVSSPEAMARRKEGLGGLGTAAELQAAAGGLIGAELLSGGAATPVAGARAVGLAGRALEGLTAVPRAVTAVGRGVEALGGASTAGRAAGYLGRGAAEGAFIGTGQAISEATLDTSANLTAEKLFAAAGQGALIGGVGNAALGGIGLVSRKAARALVPDGAESLHGIVKNFADKHTLKALGAIGQDFRGLGRTTAERQAAMGRLAADIRGASLSDGTKVFKAGDDAAALAEKVATGRREAGEQLDALRTNVNDFIETQQPALRADVRGVLAKIDEISAPLRKTEIPELVQRANNLDATFGALRRQVGSANDDAVVSLADLTMWRQNLDRVLYPQRAGGMRVGGGLPPPPPVHKAELEQARRILEDEIEATTERAVHQMGAPELAGQYTAKKRLYQSFKQAQQIADGAAARELGGRTLSLTDYLSGIAGATASVASGNVIPLAMAGGAAVVNKYARERGSSVVARMAERIGKLDRRVDAAVNAAVTGETKALPSLPKRAGVALAALAADSELATPPMRTAHPEGARFQKTLALVRDITSGSQSARDRLAAAMGEAADDHPELAQLLQERIIRSANYLAKIAPKPLVRQSLQPYLEEQRFPRSEVGKWLAAADALDLPEKILHEVAKGKTPRAEIDAVKETLPELWLEWQGRVSKSIAEQGTLIPYRRRIWLSAAFDVIGDPSLQPERMASIQQSHQLLTEQSQQQQPPAQSTRAPAAAGKLASQQATDLDRITENVA